MSFSSLTFLIFFVIVLIALGLTQLPVFYKKYKKDKLKKIRHIILLVSSYIFYGWWDWRFCFLMFLLTLVSYKTAIAIERNHDKKIYMYFGVGIPLLVLGVFKYFNFFLSSFSTLIGLKDLGTLSIILPVGISFYTFQSLSYTIDAYRGRSKVEHEFLKLALYISFFPQLVAGPIVKASEFLPQLEEERKITIRGVEQGIQIFIFGLVKKVVFSDNLSVFVDDVFGSPGAFQSSTVMLAVIAYSIQIYFDFSGYSDMAVGCAKCIGYTLPRNFNIPYISRNITEFWKRWHISLSTWLQEYLYIPLGGNRKGKVRTYINLLITMILGGLWHGASWTFVFWGFLHGMALCIHKLFLKFRGNRKQTKAGTLLSVIVTYVFVCLCWIFFRADSFDIAMTVLKKCIIWSPGIIQIYSWVIPSILLLLISTFAAYLKSNSNVISGENKKISKIQGFYPILNLNKFWSLFILCLIMGMVLGLAYTGNNPFIYFQF